MPRDIGAMPICYATCGASMLRLWVPQARASLTPTITKYVDGSAVQVRLRERRPAMVRPGPAFGQQRCAFCAPRFQPLAAWAKSQDSWLLGARRAVACKEYSAHKCGTG